MISLLLAGKILSLFLMMSMGFLIVKLGILKTGDSKVLSYLALYLITPCMILSAFQIDFTPDVRDGLLLSILAAVIVHTVTILLSLLLKKLIHLNGVEQFAIVYTNAGNLIIPIVTSLFGREWVVYTSGFVIVLQCLLWTHGKRILSGDRSFEIKKILTNINLLTIVVGLILLVTGFKLPARIADAVDSVGVMIGPISMILTGMIIAGMNFRKVLSYKRAWLVTALRLIVAPLLVIAVFRLLGLSSLSSNGKTVLLISLLAASAPAATLVVQMAQAFSGNEAADYAAAINVISTLSCIATMPLMVFLYGLF